MPKLRPNNRKNKKRNEKRAVERFQEEAISCVENILKKKFRKIFKNTKARSRYAEKVVREKIIEEEVKHFKKNENSTWNDFQFSKKQTVKIRSFLEKKIKNEILNIINSS